MLLVEFWEYLQRETLESAAVRYLLTIGQTDRKMFG
jgi:hypothetical protein